MAPLLLLQDLSVRLPPDGDRSHAVENVSLHVESDELLCIVGESGSGKSILAHAIIGLLPPNLREKSGKIIFDGRDIGNLAEDEARKLRGADIAMIFQEPMTALNQLMRIGDQIDETIRYHRSLSRRERHAIIEQALQDVGLLDTARIIESFPFQLSGGQRQRVMIAMGLVLEPKLLLADEPTTALDVTTQGQILELIRDLQKKRRMAVIFITHDFGVVAEIADRVAVMQKGRVVEEGPTKSVLCSPQHPYSKKLLSAVPKFSRRSVESKDTRNPVMTVRCITKAFYLPGKLLSSRRVDAVRDISIDLFRGECLGIVGESGSGKSTLGRLLMRLSDVDRGTILLGEADISSIGGQKLRDARRQIQMVFQDPYSSLNPRRRVGDQIACGPMTWGTARSVALANAERLLLLVGLDASSMDRFPHQFSGGQRQRVAIARALALDPQIVIADEPVSALDVTVQDQVLRLFEKIRDELGVTLVFITHDLRIAARMSDRIAVMRHGAIIELQAANDLFDRPQQAYTRALIDAVPGARWT